MRVALCAKMRSGKDTVAEILSEEGGFVEFKLSAGISKVIRDLNLGSGDGLKNRSLYQGIGQYMRTINEDVWCEYAWSEIEEYIHNHANQTSDNYTDNIVLSDIRQQNEVDFFREKGFIIVKINSSDENRRERVIKSGDIMSEEDFTYETELSVDGIHADYTINNDGTIGELYEEVRDGLKKWEVSFCRD